VSLEIGAGETRRKNTFSPLRLDANRVDVWHCFPNSIGRGQISRYLSALSRGEIARYRRMRSAERRLQFLLGRSLIRHALSHYTNTPACSWRFASNEHGRPAVDWPRAYRNIHFSLSHTSGLIAMAVSPIAEIGIDVENIARPVEISDVADLVFTQGELQRISRCSSQERERFFELWTLKEAYIKARGKGFSLQPRTFELANSQGHISLRCAADCDPTPERWQFRISKRREVRMAIAVGSRSVTRIRQIEWPPSRNAGLIHRS
jgi:4'-phosphopantetheinyl transferase